MGNLKEKIEEKKAIVGIIGLGYVGLPLAKCVTEKGFQTIGFEIDEMKLEYLKKGSSYIIDISDRNIDEMKEKGFKFVDNYKYMEYCDILIFCLPTPLNNNKVDYSILDDSIKNTKKYLKSDKLIIIESTVSIGKTREISQFLKEKNNIEFGRDIYISFSPERVNPGSSIELTKIPKVVGGLTEKCLENTERFYSKIFEKTHKVRSLEIAEAAKLLENIYRFINITLINELSEILNYLNVNIWEVIEAAGTKPFGFQKFYPGPGIGGHCLPIDPKYFNYSVKTLSQESKMINLAYDLNEQRKDYIYKKISEISDTKKILILGVSYKINTSDTRETSAKKLIELLENRGYIVDFYDPFVKEFNEKKTKNLSEISKYDLTLIHTAHSMIDYHYVYNNSKKILDLQNAMKSYKNHEKILCI